MNAVKLMTNKWVLVLGVAVLVGVMANVSLADPPRHVGYGDGYRGGMGGHSGYVDRDGDGYRSRGFSPGWQGGYGQFGRPWGFRPPMNFRPPVFRGGYDNGGCIRPGGFGGSTGTTITIIIR